MNQRTIPDRILAALSNRKDGVMMADLWKQARGTQKSVKKELHKLRDAGKIVGLMAPYGHRCWVLPEYAEARRAELDALRAEISREARKRAALRQRRRWQLRKEHKAALAQSAP